MYDPAVQKIQEHEDYSTYGEAISGGIDMNAICLFSLILKEPTNHRGMNSTCGNLQTFRKASTNYFHVLSVPKPSPFRS